MTYLFNYYELYLLICVTSFIYQFVVHITIVSILRLIKKP